jgi:hypothetical protein
MEIEALLVQQIRAHRKQLRLAGILVLALCAAGLALFFAGVIAPDGTRRTMRAIVYSFLGVPLGLGFILASLRDPRKLAAITLLRESPKKIVADHLSIPFRAPWMSKPSLRWMAKESTLILQTADGKQHRVPVAFGEEQKVAAALKSALPHAKHTAVTHARA